MKLFDKVCLQCSNISMQNYSSSFSSAVKLLDKNMRAPINSIYGFVRFADEIVDTFHEYDKQLLLAEFKHETYTAIRRGISLNPILHSFQLTVNTYDISNSLIDSFFQSMELDLHKTHYTQHDFTEYVYGSSEAVGLMCLHVFCEGDNAMFDNLEPYAKSLGAAFQKINFLRDIKDDFTELNRMYFPGCDFNAFSARDKKAIEEDIQKDLDHAYHGILLLPAKARFGVYVAYKYYLSLFRKIKKTQSQKILKQRIRISGSGKLFILAKAGLKNQLRLL